MVSDIARPALEFARTIGADVTLDAALPASFEPYARDKGTFDVALECSGTSDALVSALQVALPRAREQRMRERQLQRLQFGVGVDFDISFVFGADEGGLGLVQYESRGSPAYLTTFFVTRCSRSFSHNSWTSR